VYTKFWWGNMKGKPLEIFMHTWKINVEMDHKEIWCEVVGRIDLAQGRDQWRGLANTVTNLRVT
jgi:hypothetical protein